MFIDIHAHAYRRPAQLPDGRLLFSTPEQDRAALVEELKGIYQEWVGGEGCE